jgi:UDP-3-O-[3-hydroxymyristoyl] glucosamine N-acyltransferase
MAATVQELADLLAGKLVGDGSVSIQEARPIHEASTGHITFIETDKHLKALGHPSAVITKPNQAANGSVRIEVDDPLSAFLTVFQHLHPRPAPKPLGIDPRANIHATATLGLDCDVHPFATVGEGSTIGRGCRIHAGAVVGRYCTIGDDVVLFPNVVIYDHCVLGNRVAIHANSVIGADGFGYRQQGGKHVKVPQLGEVIVEDDVEIGACTTIDRGTFQPTRIGAGSKIDNLVQVAHNCRLGKHNLIVGQVGLAGSSSTGDYVVIAGQAAIRDHCHIGDQVMVGARAGVIWDIPNNQRVLGEPAIPDREYKKLVLCLDKLPELHKDMKRVKEKLGINGEHA